MTVDDLKRPRWLQAMVYEEGSGRRGPVRIAFQRGKTYTIPVWVGPEDPSGIRADKWFPDDMIGWDGGREKLVVVFTEPVFAHEPQVAHIDILEVGDSDRCEFKLSTELPQGLPWFPDTVQARIIVLHRNRVLQTALLTGALVEDTARAERNIGLTIEAAVRPGLGELAGRRSFDLALVVNKTILGEPTVTSVAGGEAKLTALTDVLTTIDDMVRKLTEIAGVAHEWKLGSGKGLELLQFLAQQGWSLYATLVKDCDFHDTFAGAQLIQVVSAHQQVFLPVELFYDRPSPLSTAELCPNAGSVSRAVAVTPIA